VKRNGVQNLKRDASFDAQIFDVIELIQLVKFLDKPFQIPSGRRCLEALSVSSVELALSFQNSVDGRSRRCHWTASLFHFSEDGVSTMFAERTGLLELFSQIQNALFDVVSGAIMWRHFPGRPVSPIGAIQAFALGAFNPKGNGGLGNVIFVGNSLQGLPILQILLVLEK